MYNPIDRFGQMMVKNFASKGCPLIGIHKYPHLNDQETRFTNAGFKKTEVFTMAQMYLRFNHRYNECIDKQDRLKIEKLEMLDEF